MSGCSCPKASPRTGSQPRAALQVQQYDLPIIPSRPQTDERFMETIRLLCLSLRVDVVCLHLEVYREEEGQRSKTVSLRPVCFMCARRRSGVKDE